MALELFPSILLKNHLTNGRKAGGLSYIFELKNPFFWTRAFPFSLLLPNRRDGSGDTAVVCFSVERAGGKQPQQNSNNNNNNNNTQGKRKLD